MSSKSKISRFKPTQEQDLALNWPAPLLVLAGAGTGKTTVLTGRMAEMITSRKARPNQVLALTFTDKAAIEMAERLEGILSQHGLAGSAREVRVGTFHSFGGQIVRENLLHLGFDRPPAVLSGASGWQLLSSIFDDLVLDAIEITTAHVAGVFNHILQFISQCKDHLIGPDDLERYVKALDTVSLAPAVAEYLDHRSAQLLDLAAAYRRYEGAKLERSAIDFGDHLFLPVQLFKSYPTVRDAYRRRFPYVFVDEYQDTNHAQREFLLALLNPSRPEIMVIGDDDQAIYRWRGAIVFNILRFPDETVFQPGQVKTLPMTQNRRSFPPILDLANLVIAEVQDRHPKKLGYHDENGEGKATIGHYVAASDALEGHWIAAKIRELEPEARAYQDKKRGYGAFAVLCRKRSLFEPVGRALEAAGIPYELIGGTGFYGRWEIRDILSYLRVLANPSDNLAMARILRSRRWRVSSRDLFHLGKWVRERNGKRNSVDEEQAERPVFSLFDAMQMQEEVEGLSPEAKARLAALVEELEGYAGDAQSLSLAELVRRIVDNTGYRSELLAQPEFDARVALLNLDKLEDLARQFEEGGQAGLVGFVEFVSYAVDSGEEEGEVRPIDEERDTVKVMTVHQSKGLEFPIVFIPGLAEGIFPTRGRYEADRWWELPWELRGDREHLPTIDLLGVRDGVGLKKALEKAKADEKELQLDEERRLFYVAITRAQFHLYLIRAHWYGTRKSPQGPSIFWDLIATSGLGKDLGEEPAPPSNPNLESAPSGASAVGQTASSEIADLTQTLLAGEDPRPWIEATARREGYGRWTVLRAEVDAHLESLASHKFSSGDIGGANVTCSELIQYLACQQRYRYIYVDRLPLRPSWRAAVGREVHRLIEELAGWVPAPDGPLKEDAPEDDDFKGADYEGGESAGRAWDHMSVDDMVKRFQRSIYAARPATHVEVPFQLNLRNGVVRGRMDRLDRLANGAWEVVDFKASASSSGNSSGYHHQLALYALAVRDVWQARAEQIVAHIFYLRDGQDLGLTFDEAALDQVRDEAERALHGIGLGEFVMTTDRRLCARCDYEHLCTFFLGE